MGDTLKPCPFCGGEAKTHGPYGWYSQWCISHSCKAFYTGAQDAFKDYPTEAQAITAWNTRADAGCIAELVEALDGLIDDEPCRYDHHGYCQSHFITAPCEMAVARATLAKVKGEAA